MKSHLLALSIGPVQDFIAAARRTRDLWFGSHMLSEIAKGAARAVKAAGGDLIFPHPNHEDDLDSNSEFTVANIILAETDDPQKTLVEAKRAAAEQWLAFAKEARRKSGSLIRDDVWDSQLHDVVEFYAAWTPVGPSKYKEARKRVMEILAARKSIRNFTPFLGKQGLPKSSLDGLRETVLIERARSFGPLRIKPGESLCAVGVTKRVAGDERFPSVSRVASDPWLRGVASSPAGSESLAIIRDHCEKLVRLGALSRIREKSEIYGDFPYEGTPLYVNRHGAMAKEAPSEEEAETALAPIKREIEKLEETFRSPSPYFTVLCADGDKMGKVISRASSPEEHRKLSRALSDFASEAVRIVEKHRGVRIYTGGDDVLAFLPCDTALPCARDLHDTFGEILTGALPFAQLEAPPTLSVGLAIGHVLEDLADLLKWGRDAEGRAKADGDPMERDGLAVVVRSRGGAEQHIRERWSAHGKSALPLDERLIFWAEAYSKDELPAKFGYELRSTVDFYENWNDPQGCARALKNDLERIFSRKDVSLSSEAQQIAKDRILSGISDAPALDRLADELIIGQWVSESMEQSKGGKKRAPDHNPA